MPHGGGGGSSGGGFHGGSSHSGGSSYQTHYSNKPFKGARPYFYYVGYNPCLVYSDVDPKTNKTPFVFPMIVIAIMALIEPVVVFASSYHKPNKNLATHEETLFLDDQTNVITDAEEVQLKSIFTEFHEKTGVMPAIMTVKNSEWYNWIELEDYAYSKYTSTWQDESHWLILYSAADGTEKTNWHYEIMQGYDSDDILYDSMKDRYFHPVLCDSLDGSLSVGESFIKSFNTLLPELMKEDFYVEAEAIVFTVIWEGFLALAIYGMISTHRKEKAMNTAEPFPEGQSVELKQCPNCGASYYKGTVDRCRKCGRSFLDDEFEGF